MSTAGLALTTDQALAVLAPGERVHTYVAGSVAMIGADWERDDAEAAIRGADIRLLSGGVARATGHGLVIGRPDGRSVFFATDKEALAAVEAEVVAP
jgi:hypothetical protein